MLSLQGGFVVTMATTTSACHAAKQHKSSWATHAATVVIKSNWPY